MVLVVQMTLLRSSILIYVIIAVKTAITYNLF